MKLQPTLGFIGKEFTLSKVNDISIAKGVIGVDKEIVKSGDKDVTFVYVTCFGSTAEYLANYGGKGARIFIQKWTVEQKIIDDKMYYDFLIQQVKILDKKKEAN